MLMFQQLVVAVIVSRINALMSYDSSLRKYTQQMSANVIIDKFSI